MRSFFVVLLAITFLIPAFAPTTALARETCDFDYSDQPINLSQLLPLVEDTPYPRGIYWQVSKGEARSIVYGTVHIDDERLNIPQSLFDAVAKADRLYLEVDDPSQQDLNVILRNLDVFFQIDGPDLRPMFSPDDWDFLMSRLAPINIPEVMANRLKPWALGAAMFFDACFLEQMSQSSPGVDDQLMRFARRNDIEIGALETLEELLALVDNRDFDADLAGVKTLVSIARSVDLDAVAASMNPDWTMQMYLIEEIQVLWAITEREMRGAIDHPIADDLLAGAHDLLLVKRNTSWMKTLIPALEEGNKVVAVGALHLPGEHGILRLLEKQGFLIERIVE